MGKYFHLPFSVTFIIIAANIAVMECRMTVKQMEIAGKMMRESCQPKFDLNDEIIDGMRIGKFPEDEELKCYVNCMLELGLFIRDGVPNVDFVLQQIPKMLPDELREPYFNAVTACRNAADGVVGKCEIAFTLVKCINKNNPQVLIP